MAKPYRNRKRRRGYSKYADDCVDEEQPSAANVRLDPQMEKNTSLLLQFKNLINDPLVKKAIRIGSEVSTAIQPFSEKPTLWNGLKSAFLIGKGFIDQFEIWSHDYFEDESEWMEPFPRDFTGAIVKVLKRFSYETVKTSTEGNDIHLVTMPEGRVGWVINTKFTTFRVDRIYGETAKIGAIRDRIKQLLWEQFDGQPLILRKNQVTMRSLEEDRIVLEVDEAFKPMPSAIATEYTTYLKRALDGGVYRSVMLYGPPGTGKSTAARTIITGLNLRSFRVRVEDIGGMENNTLFEAIDIFKPEAIILDDFDRAHGQEHLLETLEHFHNHIKLVIATVNHRNNLDEALLRPGRFDELILVKKMDDEVIKAVLGEDNLDQFETLKDWPIAFIQEFVKRRRFMSKEEATKSITELAARVERLAEYDDEESWKRVKQDAPDPEPVGAQRGSFRLNRLKKKRSMLLTRREDDVVIDSPLDPNLLLEKAREEAS